MCIRDRPKPDNNQFDYITLLPNNVSPMNKRYTTVFSLSAILFYSYLFPHAKSPVITELFHHRFDSAESFPPTKSPYILYFLSLSSHHIQNLHIPASFVTSICTVLLLILNCFAVCRTVALFSMIYAAISTARSSI